MGFDHVDFGAFDNLFRDSTKPFNIGAAIGMGGHQSRERPTTNPRLPSSAYWSDHVGKALQGEELAFQCARPVRLR